MTTADLIELSDLNYAESMRELTRRAGGVVHDEGGVLLFATTHNLPVLSNGAVRTNPRVAPADVLQRAQEFFAQHRRGYSILVGAHCDQDVREAAAAAGLNEMGSPPGMVLDHRLAEAVAPPGVNLHRVANDADRIAFADIMEAAYATYGMPPGITALAFNNLDVLSAPHIVSYLADIDGQPAAGAMVIVTHGVAGIYWVGTKPEGRGRGLAELCTRAAGNAGFDLGARIAALQASVMGEPVYLRMGYFEVTRYPYLVQVNPG